MGTCNQLLIVIGILVSNLVGLGTATVPLWRLNYVLVVAPALTQAILMHRCRESPRYLVSRNRIEDAKEALQKFRGDADITDELDEIVKGQMMSGMAENVRKNPNIDMSTKESGMGDARKPLSIVQLFQDPALRRITLIVVTLHALQQLSGINGVMYYSSAIFGRVFDESYAKYAVVGVSVLNFLMTIVSVALIEKMGRKALLLLSTGGVCLFSLLLTIASVQGINWLLVTCGT